MYNRTYCRSDHIHIILAFIKHINNVRLYNDTLLIARQDDYMHIYNKDVRDIEPISNDIFTDWFNQFLDEKPITSFYLLWDKAETFTINIDGFYQYDGNKKLVIDSNYKRMFIFHNNNICNMCTGNIKPVISFSFKVKNENGTDFIEKCKNILSNFTLTKKDVVDRLKSAIENNPFLYKSQDEFIEEVVNFDKDVYEKYKASKMISNFI